MTAAAAGGPVGFYEVTRVVEASASFISGPIGAALLLGAAIPPEHRQRVVRVITANLPAAAPATEDDPGAEGLQWEHDGVLIVLRTLPDGSCKATCRIEPRASDGS